MQIGEELQVLRFQHGLAAAFSFDVDFICTQRCSCLFKLSIATGSLSAEALFVSNGLLHFLPGSGLSFDETLLPVSFGARTQHVCPCCLFASLCCGDLRLRLINSSARLLNAR